MKWPYIKYRVLKALKGPVYASRAMGCTVGTGCRILSKIVTTEPWLVTVGDRVTISSQVTLVTHDGTGWLHRDERGRRFRYAPVTIGSDVFVGTGAIIMPGVAIGDRCVIGAGSVVTRSVPSGLVVAGNPARPVSSYDDLMAKVGGWPAESDMRGESYRSRVDSVRETGPRPPMDLGGLS
ncbi:MULTISPECIES: DapH/DapD/GlmU-related protein [Microbacterium]|uniref:acyltransferase n=1 Tax=Microbacterium TaxID=33882 RepID=UPI002788F55B|nr:MULTISPECIES: acyltransferase [Microbacterium]MDQ1074387.1 acetyltransferase-like isoleucine patch superfamily enzyme [Microbacterium sp. SORGH_AS_0969]MDQ1114617.1 acetyltransferase-like isoleucine patch superfamily enzyme [Microbacterium testaceum]